MSRSNNIATSFRLSRGEAKLIRVGLLRVASGHTLWKERGSPSCSPSRMLFQAGRRDEGEYDLECMATISRVIATATGSFTTASRRLRLDAFGLAASVLGARVTDMMVRHGHTQAWLRNQKDTTRRLLAKLEPLRKRAKRGYIRAHGHAAFTEASRRWQDFARFVRAYFLYCTCNRPRLLGGGRGAVQKLIVKDWILYFREELPASGIRVPGDQELRHLVRRALRSARRSTADMGLMAVRRDRALVRDRIRKFVVARCREEPEKGPPSVRVIDPEIKFGKEGAKR